MERPFEYARVSSCLVTRVVYLEMAYSLNTDLFINRFTRMTSGGGHAPTYVISDNGGNFVGAGRELRELVNAWN